VECQPTYLVIDGKLKAKYKLYIATTFVLLSWEGKKGYQN
jgi:hypothetical protein